MGDVMGDLSSRRGKILGMGSDGGKQQIRATVPLAELYKYSTHLRSITQGRGGYAREVLALRRGAARERGQGDRGSAGGEEGRASRS